jgi:hypothetical protein
MRSDAEYLVAALSIEQRATPNVFEQRKVAMRHRWPHDAVLDELLRRE